MNPIKDYLKCAYENKAVLAGYISMTAAIGLPIIGRAVGCDLDEAAKYLGVVAGSCLLTTGAGINTIKWKYFASYRIIRCNRVIKSYISIGKQWNYYRSSTTSYSDW